MARPRSDYERLEQLLQEAERRAQQAEKDKKQAEEDKKQAEEDKKQAEQREKQAKEGEKQAKEGDRRTTLEEHLKACHELSKSIQIETDATLTTQGDTTDPYHRKYPKRIIPWDKLKRNDLFVQEKDSPVQKKEMDFPDLQKEIWEKLRREPTFLSQELFASLNEMKYVKRTITKIDSEMALREFERDTVENMVRFGIGEIYKNEVLRDEFQLQGEVTFRSHLNLGKKEKSIDETMQQMRIDDPSTPGPGDKAKGKAKSKAKGGRLADQFCIYYRTGKNGISTLAIEYKPPHKLSQDDIVTGLREIEPDRDVIGKDGEDFSFHSMRLITAVITQLFSYMIRIGVQYGYICTGEAFIFIKVADDPSTVYYYLSIPNQDVEQASDWHRTAVAQVLAFTLYTLAVEPPGQSWHNDAARLDTWYVEYEDVLRSIPETVRKDRDHTPYKAGSWKGPERSQIRTRSQCQPPADQVGDDDDDTPPTPSPSDRREGGTTGTRRTTGTTGSRGTGGTGGKRGGGKRGGKDSSRRYCTQECLRGLLTGGKLDQKCPNVEEHRGKAKIRDKHAISASLFLRLMRNQLATDPDTVCKPLYIQGARGVLFRLTLTSRGYTVAAKGTISTLVPYLQHEAAVYKRLQPIQGTRIPVCLGAIDLVGPYYHNGDEIVHMLFLSWGGISIDEHIDRDNADNVLAQATSSLQAIHQLGVLHKDAMPRNMLWNTEGRGVMVVDFERAKVLERRVTKKRQELGMISPNQMSRKNAKTESKLDGETEKEREKNGTQYIMEVKSMRAILARCVR